MCRSDARHIRGSDEVSDAVPLFIFFYSAIYFIESAAAFHIRGLLVEVD